MKNKLLLYVSFAYMHMVNICTYIYSLILEATNLSPKHPHSIRYSSLRPSCPKYFNILTRYFFHSFVSKNPNEFALFYEMSGKCHEILSRPEQAILHNQPRLYRFK